MDSGYGPAVRRFWWVLALGGVFAVLVAFLMVYSVGAGGVTHREKPVYTAEARLFVTSGDAPYLRTSVPREVPIGTDDAQTATRPVVQINDAPDVKTLVDAANVYPLLIESDDVANLRTQLYGDLPGEVTAQAIFASATANRYQPSQIPIIELFATSDRPKEAIALAAATSKTFQKWMAREQSRAGINPKQRIQIKDLETPTEATASGSEGIGLPILAVLAILTAFGAGAIMLDRMYPRRPDDGVAEDGSKRRATDESDADSLDRHVGISETG
jgi:hypothetical protein